MSRRRALSLAVILGGFLLALLLSNFLHTERTPFESTSCPACHFQAASLAAGLASAFLLPALVLLAFLTLVNTPAEAVDFVIGIYSRSPPGR
jgi:hypothetical protein